MGNPGTRLCHKSEIRPRISSSLCKTPYGGKELGQSPLPASPELRCQSISQLIKGDVLTGRTELVVARESLKHRRLPQRDSPILFGMAETAISIAKHEELSWEPLYPTPYGRIRSDRSNQFVCGGTKRVDLYCNSRFRPVQKPGFASSSEN